jgi:diguanylate cyclase (GGDEF)-like protein
MKTNHKFTLILLIMLTALLIATLINVAFNFRAHAIKSAIDKSYITASMVKDALTAHMLNGTMEKRQDYLNRITHKDYIEKLWIVRSPAIDKQYGKGFINEYIRDSIDEKVLKTGKAIKEIKENSEGVHLRITIPYTASIENIPNCLACHNVTQDTVLGAISMEFDISDIRDTGALTLLKILIVNIIFIIIAIILTNHYLKPFIQHFENLKEGIGRAYHGDFSFTFDTTLKGEGAEVTERLNHLFRKMEDTFGHIKQNLSTFLSQSKLACDDPLQEAQLIIKELSDVYKFKKTIELDESKSAIYKRLIYIINTKFEIDIFTLYEVHKKSSQRIEIYSNTQNKACTATMENLNECRAYRTDSVIISSDFPDLCTYCSASNMHYLCIPFTINDEVSLLLTMYTDDSNVLDSYHEKVNNIENYFEAAKPVVESRILMDQLRDSSLRDGMTGLYNRRFLEEFIDKVMKQTLRENGSYSVLMIDIDFFKLVNDNYGHDAGDIIIKGLSSILEANIRSSDLAIRYGGEEFTILLHNATDKSAEDIAQKIKENFNSTKFDVGTETIQKTLSIGVAHFPKDADSVWKVIKYADTALYEAKNTGRNKVVRFTKDMFSYEEENV